MSSASGGPEVSEDLVRKLGGDRGAVEELYDQAYSELRMLARRQLRREPGGTLQTTEVIHEAYVRLHERVELGLNDKTHFFALSARAMRRVLIDHFRNRKAQKRGGGTPNLPLEEGLIPTGERGEVLLNLDEALDGLAAVSERLAQIVEYKFFGGMTEGEIGEILGVSDRTVRNDWRKAKAWLTREMSAS